MATTMLGSSAVDGKRFLESNTYFIVIKKGANYVQHWGQVQLTVKGSSNRTLPRFEEP